MGSVFHIVTKNKEADGHNVSDTKFQAPLLQYTLRLALRENYTLVERDIDFYTKHKKLYNYTIDETT